MYVCTYSNIVLPSPTALAASCGMTSTEQTALALASRLQYNPTLLLYSLCGYQICVHCRTHFPSIF